MRAIVIHCISSGPGIGPRTYRVAGPLPRESNTLRKGVNLAHL
jgi:hypothetical protein